MALAAHADADAPRRAGWAQLCRLAVADAVMVTPVAVMVRSGLRDTRAQGQDQGQGGDSSFHRVLSPGKSSGSVA